MSERLWSLATPKGVNLDAISRGNPEITAADLGVCAGGLDKMAFAAAMYSYAGDLTVWRRLHSYLLEFLLAEREAHQWTKWVETVEGCRTQFAYDLVKLFLLEELSPAAFQSSPNIRAVFLGVEPSEWRRAVSHQWACIAGEYGRLLLTAEEHVKRKMRRGIDG